MLRTILAEHGAHRNQCSRENARKAPSSDHLRNTLAHAKQRGRDRDAEQTSDEYRLPSIAVRCFAPEDHDAHLREGEEGLNEAGVEADVFFLDAADVLDHGVDVGEDGEEGYGLHDASVAE